MTLLVNRFINCNKSFPYGMLILLMVCIISLPSVAQERNEFDEPTRFAKKGFHFGLLLGAYFPNSYSASLYDGYGYDAEGNRNSFENSWMYQKIINQYGGGLGSNPDYIAEELGVPSDNWFFNESDMPQNMKYKTAINVGLNVRYSTDGKNAAIINVNASILKAAGNFTITTTPSGGSSQINNSIKTFNIAGREQRIHFQIGYQRLMGKGEGMYLLVEAGMHGTLAKFDQNEIQINNLVINLFENYYDQVGNYTYFTGSKEVGFGFGAFWGLGLHIQTTGPWNLQLLYNPLLEKVNIGYAPRLKLNHAAGLRMYYKL